jgi:hypothetical protein
MPVTPTMPVGEALWPQQNLLDIQMPEAWGLPGGGTLVPNLGVNRVYTCVIDNGAQSFTGGGGNPELVRPGNFGWDIGGVAAATLGGPTGPGAAEGGHGTACAGILGADWQATSGVVGVAPLSPIFSLALTAPAALSDVTGAINAAVTTALPNADPGGTAERDKQHRRVILLSAFHDAYAATSALSTAIANAIAADVPVIVPSGDDDASTIPYPATDPGVIVCGAVRPTTGARVSAEPLGHGTNHGGASWGSNFSATQPFVSAPGFAITSTDLNGAAGYAAAGYVTNFQGTSAAAAHAAGVATLLLAHNPRLTAHDVRTILYRTADKVGGVFSPSDSNHPDGTWNQNVGYGRINALNAVIEARRVRAEVTETAGCDPALIDFGSVQPGQTAQVSIRLRHATTLCTHPITFVLPTVLPAHCQWASGTPASVTLASGAAQTVSLQYVAPTAAEDGSAPIQFLTDDYLARSITLSVHAKSAAAVPPVWNSSGKRWFLLASFLLGLGILSARRIRFGRARRSVFS